MSSATLGVSSIPVGMTYTMPTIIQTHLITCENWAETMKKAKEL